MTSKEKKDIVERLNDRFPVCPFDRRSPDYWKDFTGKPCPVCGGTEEGPDMCHGADTRILQEAADTIERLREALTFYKDQWFQNAEGDDSTPGLLRTWREPTDALWDDAGAKARQALEPRP